MLNRVKDLYSSLIRGIGKRYRLLIGGVVASALIGLTALFAVLWVIAAGDKASLEDELTEATADITRLEGQLKTVRGNLEKTKADLGEMEVVLGETEATLGETEAVLGETEAVLGETEAVLGQTEVTLEETEGELTTTQSQLASVEAEVNAARQQLASIESQLGAAQADLANVQQAAQQCRDAGQTFVNSVNAFNDVFNRWLIDQASDAELNTAGGQLDTAYFTFLGQCNLQG